MTLAVRPVDARPRVIRARRWAKANLFSTWANSALTVVSVVVLGWAVFSLGRFVLVSADWSVIEANRRLLAVGRFPPGEEWRLWPPLYAILVFGGLAFGSWLTDMRCGGVVVLGVLAFLFGFLFEGQNPLLLALALGLSALAYIGARRACDTPLAGRVRVIAVVGLALVVPLMVVMLQVGDGVRTSVWGGIFLNLRVSGP